MSFTNTTSGVLILAVDLSVTNELGNTVVHYAWDSFDRVNLYFKTNTVSVAIDSVTMNGKVMGQTCQRMPPWAITRTATYPNLNDSRYHRVLNEVELDEILTSTSVGCLPNLSTNGVSIINSSSV